MKKIIYVMMLFTLVLVACSKTPVPIEDNTVERKDNSNVEEVDESSKDESNKDDSNKDDSVEDSKQEEKKDEPLIKREELTRDQILAMTWFDQIPIESDNYILPDANDVIQNKYTYKMNMPDRSIEYKELTGITKIGLIPYINRGSFDLAYPYEVDIFYVLPSANSHGDSYFSIGEEYVILGTTQEAPRYNDTEPSENGPPLASEYRIDDLYEKYKDDERVIQLANMFEEYPDRDEYYKNNPEADPHNN